MWTIVELHNKFDADFCYWWFVEGRHDVFYFVVGLMFVTLLIRSWYDNS